MTYLYQINAKFKLNTQFIVLFLLFALVLMSSAHAVPTGIEALKTGGDRIMPYVVWIFTLGCAAIASLGGWMLGHGQPKGLVPMTLGGCGAGLGFLGLFGENAATLLI